MMTVGERMRIRRKEIGISAEKLSEKLGVSPATIYRYESGDIEKLPVSLLTPIAESLSTSEAYLMGWDDSNSIYSIPGIEPLPKMKQVPLLGDIACGEPILAQENIEQLVSMPESMHADFALRCKGDSMINAHIYDGSIVYIRQQPDVENGEIAAVIIDGEATLKRVYKYPGKVILQPENPDFPPLVYIGDEVNDMRIIGRAIAHTSLIQ